ncbi:hypothetical protein LARI1_G009087 [Lachnellula arida]|uniref:Uncharacterized protein n=2 Tax=Lachnellula TaxID=47830 RepID=A0A8T9AYS4_9HELO|nr:hypothetical protein LARI1_G009087 [Lachnellula arida]TVY89281.1 hypothetical protein LAWI1_G008311 [Lachnellula willkommii]
MADLTAQEKKNADSSYYESTMRWVENTYLSWFGENRTSYGIKDSMKQTQVDTGNKDVDGAQEGVGNAVGDAFGKGGVAGEAGDAADKGFLSR